MNLFPSQSSVVRELEQNKRKEVFFVAGKGCGKSHLGATILLTHASVKGTVTFMGAASETIMGISTFPALKEVCREFKLIEGVHYCVGKLPPPEWNVQPFSSSISVRNIITWRWGSYTIFKTLSDPEAVEGAQFDFAWIDEYGLMDIPEVRRMLRDRMRGKRYIELGRKHQMLFTGTPPNKPAQLRELQNIRDVVSKKDKEVVMIFGKTTENTTLPADYIDYNKDPINFRRDYEGSLEMEAANRWAYNWDDSKHIKATQKQNGIIYIFHDFNINPGVCIVAQMSQDRKRISIIDEVFLEKGDLPQVCEIVKSRYPDTRYYMVGGDAAGHAGTHLELGKTSYRVIMQKYGIGENQLIIRKKNPLHVDSSLLLNSLLYSPDSILVDPKCKHLIEDCQMVGRDTDGDLVPPSPLHGHLFDCMRYAVWDLMRDFVKWK